MNLITLPAMASDPSPSPSPLTCNQVLKKCDEVIDAKNKVIDDYKKIVKDQEQLNWTLKEENKEKDHDASIMRVLASLGILGSLIAGIFLGRAIK